MLLDSTTFELTIRSPVRQTPLPEREGCRPEQVAAALRSFYAALFSLEMPAFDRLLSSRLRVQVRGWPGGDGWRYPWLNWPQARNSIALGLATAYEELHAKVLVAFDPQVQSALAHDPTEVRTLLDV